MSNIFFKSGKFEDCCDCEACYNICPQKCINHKEDSLMFSVPEIDLTKCIHCNLCSKICEEKNNIPVSKPKLIACASNNQEILFNSSSGGFFFTFAEYLIKEYDAIIFGAAYDDDLELSHIAITELNNLRKIQKTKYTKSKLNNTFCKVEKFLKNNKIVLFSGLPCQISGLKSYLEMKKCDMSYLITIDLICSGVPSPDIVKRYFTEKYDQIVSIDFRDKEIAWNNPQIKIYTKNGIFTENYYDSDFQFIFANGLSTRKSCFQCVFSGTSHLSDFTIGDFWGIEENSSRFNTKKGVSEVLIHTEKGERYFNEIKELFQYEQFNIDTIKLQERLKSPPVLYGDQNFFSFLVKHFTIKKSVSIYKKEYNSLIKKVLMKFICFKR